MASNGKEYIAIVCFSLIGASLWYYRPGPLSLARLAIHGLLSLGAVTLLLHFLNRWRWKSQNTSEDRQSLPGPDEQYGEKREREQDKYQQQVASYSERILQPRLEAKQRRKEEEHRRFTGPAWKGASHKLGGEVVDGGDDSLSRVAAQNRTLPPEPTPPPLPPPKVKQVIVLPDEPEQGQEGVITLEFRTPAGRCHRRRFNKDDPIKIAMDYMSTVGYHSKVYCLCTMFPHTVISYDPARTLRELGIVTNSAVRVDDWASNVDADDQENGDGCEAEENAS